MGYTTQFDGILSFKKELTMPALRKLKTFLGEDCREHAEWGNINLTYIDLKLNDDLTGLEWDGSEKTYNLEEKINLIIEQMKTDFPDFELTGELFAQGEDVGDVYKIRMTNNKAEVKEISVFSDSGNDTFPEDKDYKRIDDMISKAGIQSPDRTLLDKLNSAGSKMAISITDANKAERRGIAAKHRGFTELAEIFFKRAKELGHRD